MRFIKHRLGPARIPVSPCVLALCALAGQAFAEIPSEPQLEAAFQNKARPFIETYCVDCHGGEKPKAELNLNAYANLSDVLKGFEYWELALDRMEAGEMPPKKAELHPPPEVRQQVVDWIASLRRQQAAKFAGDPGPVLARRLSNAEYDYTIRDLTGADIRPTREFPVDPANQAGFDNSGESLSMSPALFKKYLQAAQTVASHLALTPDGFTFAPHPMLVETDRDKFCVHRIVEFYWRQPTDYADYFEAAWRFRHRAALGQSRAPLFEIADEAGVSVHYLELICSALTDPAEEVGPIANLQSLWRELPMPHEQRQPEGVREGCERMRDFVKDLRAKLEWDFQNLRLRGFSSGGQAFIGWKNRRFAEHRRMLNPDMLQIEGQPKFVEVGPKADSVNGASRRDNQGKSELKEVPPDPDLTIPAEESRRPDYIAAFERFCGLFPDTFYRDQRGRMHFDKVKEKQDKGRYLSAGFHNMMGYFRDDRPLYDLILDEQGRRELDRLWLEFDFIARVPERQHAEFIFYERAETSTMRGPEFDFARSEDKNAASEAMIKRLADVYLDKARNSVEENGGDPMLIDVIADHFEITNANIRRVEKARRDAEPRHLEALLEFAARAYRRPLSDSEQEDLPAFYRSLREQDLNHEEAIRDSVAGVLVSPHFSYRINLAESPGAANPTQISDLKLQIPRNARPLTAYELAGRLSYFLWSSMPDRELLERAASGELLKPDELIGQARRMLKDDRVRGLAAEFGGNWLEFRRFQEHNAVDRERFPEFDDALREAMFEEPIRFFLDVAQNDRSVLDFLYADDTFVNGDLANHYGMESLDIAPNQWRRVANAGQFGRGGLLPMAVFLTKNAPGLRTSPVKRGYWVVRRILGERIPPPPPTVPELPRDESKMELSLRDALAKHREDPSCASCHERFDALGLVFEEYGPVGERRVQDLAGRPVDARAAFPNGMEGAGLHGLKGYIRAQREEDFIENLCDKLFAYALGRTLILSDDSAIQEMKSKMAANGNRFGDLIETIVASPQFRTKRIHDELARN